MENLESEIERSIQTGNILTLCESFIVINILRNLTPIEMNGNFYCALQEQMHQHPDNVFLDSLDGTPTSYGEANELSARLANKLVDLGVKPGDRLCAQVHKSTAVVTLYLACLRAGILYLPLNTAYTLYELRHFLEDAEPSVVVCDPERHDEVQTLGNECGVKTVLTLDRDGTGTLNHQLDSYSSQHTVVFRKDSDTAILIYTSGTTGKPKGAKITHGNIQTNSRVLNELWEWREEDVLLHVLPLFHVHGLFNALHVPMLKASRVIFRKEFSVDETIELIPHASVLMAVPTIYSRLVAHSGLNKRLCKDFRIFISGSAPLLPQTFDEFERKTGHRILERYGMSEAAMITSNPLRGERISGTVGKALASVSLRVCDEEGTRLPNGEIGVLEVKGPNVFKGYWRNEKATRKAFREDGYFISGDLAMINDKGIVTIVGRDSDLIISAGFNIYPAEVEQQLNQIPGVKESAVFGVHHRDLGEGVVAAIVPEQLADLTEEGIVDALEGNLSSFKLPRAVFIVDELPTNAMGKVEKKKLREKYKHLFDS